MSHQDREGLENQYDINLVNAEIAQIQREQAEAEEAAAAAAAAAAVVADAHHHHHHGEMGDGNTDDYLNTSIQGEEEHVVEPPKKRKRKIYQTEDGIKKCSRCRVKRVDEPREILEKYATCLNCRTKRKIDSRKHQEESEYQLPSAESTADALTAAMNATRNDGVSLKTKLEDAQIQSRKKPKKSPKQSPAQENYFKEVARRLKMKDYANLPNLYTHYGDFVDRIRLNCEHDLFDHHFRGYSDESFLPRYKLEEVDADTFQYVSRKIISLYIQPLMDVTGYRFPVRDYHKGGSKSKKVTFMFICSQDKTKQRKSRSTDQRKIANRLKVNECDSKINLNYDLCTGFLQINFNHKAHHPYMWKAESIQLHKNSGQYMEDVDTVEYRHPRHEENEDNSDVMHHHPDNDSAGDLDHHQQHNGHQHHEHNRDVDTDNIDLNLIDSIPASSMQYLTSVEEDVAAVVNAQRERDQERQAELDRQAVEDAANQFLQAQARQLKEDQANQDQLDQNDLGQDEGVEIDENGKTHLNVDNIDQELLNMG